MAFNYPDEIRSDLSQAHNQYWLELQAPGSWWDSEQRIAIAAASRDAVSCDLCAKRRDALSPNAVAGDHAGSDKGMGVLPAAAIDAVHRIVTDQSRLSESYIVSNEQHGVTKPAYVELVGIVVAVLSIDEFHRAMGLPLESLPNPIVGAPDGYQPKQAVEGTGFVPMIPVEGATGAESDLWAKDRTANVLRALSLVPNAVRSWLNLSAAQYLSIESMGNFDQPEGRHLNRMQIELVAGRVSAMNECFY